MKCPNCGQRPLAFSQWLRTWNPFSVECAHCHTRLRAGPVAYVATLLHVPIGVGVAVLLSSAPARESAAMFGAFVLLAFGLLFCTAYVIPYYFVDGYYRVADDA